MSRLFLHSIFLLLPLLANGARESEDNRVFYVGSHGWHTSIIVPRSQIPKNAWPREVVERTFVGYPYLEVGWGDRKFYPAPHPGIAMAIDAAVFPGPSVLHIVGLKPPLPSALPWSNLVRVQCTSKEFASLSHALGQSFELDADGGTHTLGPGLYGMSRFYPARGRYYWLNTCDTWTARMMRAGGLDADTSPIGTRSAGAIIAQARRLVARKQSAPKNSDLSNSSHLGESLH